MGKAKRHIYILFLVTAIILALTSCLPFGLLKGPVLKFSVVRANGSSGVPTALITVYDHFTGNYLGMARTGNDGAASVTLKEEADYVDVIFTGEDSAVSKISGLNVEIAEDQVIETILRQALLELNQSASSAPVVSVEFLNSNNQPLVNRTVSANFKAQIQVNGTNQIKVLYAALGEVPGSSRLTPEKQTAIDTTEVTFEFDSTGYNGLTPFHVVVYDHNDNRVDHIEYLDVTVSTSEATNLYQPLPFNFLKELWGDEPTFKNLFCYTGNVDGISYYRKNNLYGRNPESFEPTAAPAEGTLWIDIQWLDYANYGNYGIGDPLEFDRPDGYNIYRSFDGTNYSKIAFVSQERTEWSSIGSHVDKSALLEVGKKVWYRVTSVYGVIESTPTDLGSVIPLESFEVLQLSPSNGTAGVSRNPTFIWKPSQAVTSEEGMVTYRYFMEITDFVQSSYEILPGTIDDFNYFKAYEFERTTPNQVEAIFFGNQDVPMDYKWFVAAGGLFQYPNTGLEANKTYEWVVGGACAYVSDEDSSSYSVAAGLYMDGPGVPIKGLNTFTTCE